MGCSPEVEQLRTPYSADNKPPEKTPTPQPRLIKDTSMQDMLTILTAGLAGE